MYDSLYTQYGIVLGDYQRYQRRFEYINLTAQPVACKCETILSVRPSVRLSFILVDCNYAVQSCSSIHVFDSGAERRLPTTTTACYQEGG